MAGSILKLVSCLCNIIERSTIEVYVDSLLSLSGGNVVINIHQSSHIDTFCSCE